MNEDRPSVEDMSYASRSTGVLDAARLPELPRMHAILTPVGSSGDINPFLTLGRGLRQRGHDVTLLGPEPFARPAAAAGLEFVSVWSAEDYDRVTKDPDLWHPTRGTSLIFRTMGAQLRQAYALIEDVYQPSRSVLVGHTLSFATRVFEEVHRAPAVTVHLAPSIFRSEFRQPAVAPGRDVSSWPRWVKRTMWWMLDRFFLDPLIVPTLNGWRAELGLLPVFRPLRSWVHSPQRVLGLFPEWFGGPQPDWPAQLVLAGFVMGDDSESPSLRTGPPCNGVVPSAQQIIGDGPPPLVFTPGSANRQARSFFRAAVEASQQLGRRALLVTSYREHLPVTLPPQVQHVPYAAFTTLFPLAAAVVHHGGIGTCAQGLAAGVPQVIMPMGFDQPDNALQLTRLGVAGMVKPGEFTGRAVARTLDRVLSDQAVRDACARYADKIRAEPSLARACDAIESVSSTKPLPHGGR